MNNEILHNHKRMRSTHPMQKKEVVSLLLKLSRQGRASELRELIKEYEDVIKYIINKTDNGKLAALHYAARNEAFDCVRILVEEGGADVNMKTCEQFTPLHFAARYRRQTGKPTTEFIGATPARQNPRPSVDSEIGGPLSTKVPENTDHELSCAVKETETVLPDEVIHYLVDHGAQLNGQDANGWTALHYAAIRGNEVATHQLLKEPGIDFELADHDGMRPLHLAVAHNETEIVRCLLSAKADPFAVSHRGNLPIHFACTTCNVDLVKLLLSYCGNEEDCQTVLNAPNRDGETPLHWSVVKGHEKVVQLCLKKKADPNLTAFTGETSLHMAARVGSVEIARVLIQEGVCLDSEDVMLQTALHKAAERNNLDVVNLLLENGSDMENEDHNAFTPLLLAVSKGHVEILQLLADQNANLFAQEKNGKSAVYLCAEGNRLEALRAILAKKQAVPMIDVPNIYGNTPLHAASKQGHLEIVKLLLENGADLLAKNERESLAFHYAAKRGRLHIVRLFLRKSPGMVSELDEDGNSAIHLAASNGHQNVTDLLLKYGAAVDSRNSLRWTPLDCAAANGHRSCARFLLENGSPVDPRDVSNTTPLHLACKHGHTHVVELLLSWGADPGVRMVINENLPGYGPNALDSAIDHGQKSCAMILLQSTNWKRALRNQTVSSNGILTTPMRKLIIYMPEIAEMVMDRCLTTKPCSMDQGEFNISHYNFEFIEDTYAHWFRRANLRTHGTIYPRSPLRFAKRRTNDDRCLARARPKESVKGRLQFSFSLDEDDSEVTEDDDMRPYTRDSQNWNKNHPLMLMIHYKRARLLEHKLATMLLKRKWLRAGLVYYVNLFVYILFLAFYSTNMLITKSGDLVLRKNATLKNISVIDACLNGLLKHPDQPIPSAIMISKYVVLALSATNLVKEMAQLFFTGRRYFTLENCMEFSIFVLAILSVLDVYNCFNNYGLKKGWQWQCGAVGIFLAWLNLLLFLRRIPTLGLFVLMFTVIIRTFINFFAVFFLFIFAFAFGFHILLSNHAQFNSLGNSLMKTSVMTMGELDFDSLFNTQFESNTYESLIFFDGITYSLFVGFLIVMTLVIMNLLVGLAVDDIKGVQNQAVVKRVAMQIQLLLDIDSFLPHWIRKRLEPRMLSVRTFQNTSCSAATVKNGLRLFWNRMCDDFESNEEAQSDDELHQIQRRMNLMDQKLADLQVNQNGVMNSLSHIITNLRHITCGTSSSSATELEAISVRRGSLLTVMNDHTSGLVRPA